jgi:hypothetical protein
MTVSLLFLGQLTIQAQAFLSYLHEHGYEVTAVNTLPWSIPKKIGDANIPVYNFYEDSKISAAFARRLDLEWCRKVALYSIARNLNLKNGKLERIIEKTGIDIIYGSWGSQSLPEIGMAQEFHIPTVYEFLTYPTTSNTLTEKVENFFNRRIVNNLDGRVFSTKRMTRYMSTTFGESRGENLVFMECYPKKFHYRKRLPLLSEFDGQPHIVFIGMDVWGILPQIEEIASRKIHIHMTSANQTGWLENKRGDASRIFAPKNTSFIHQYNRFTYGEIADGTFATFLTQFDSCLVTYNFSGFSSLTKFANSIPSRFSTALLAGIPIIVPSGYLKGCEEIIRRHQIGFAFKSYADLSNKLNNKNVLNSCANNAISNSSLFSLENNFNRMDKFLKRIINGF